jgi:hypothetical protein
MLAQKFYTKLLVGMLISCCALPLYSVNKSGIDEELALVDIPRTLVPLPAKEGGPLTTRELQTHYEFLFSSLQFLNYRVQTIFLHALIPTSYVTYQTWRQCITDIAVFAQKLKSVVKTIDQEQSQQKLASLQEEGIVLVKRIRGLLSATQQAVQSAIIYRDSLPKDKVSERIRATLVSLSPEIVTELEESCNNIIANDQLKLFALVMRFENLHDAWAPYTFQTPAINDPDKQKREKFAQNIEEMRAITKKLAASMRTQFATILTEDATLPVQFKTMAETFIYKIVPHVDTSLSQKIAQTLTTPKVSTEDLRDQLIELLFSIRIARHLQQNQLFFITYRIASTKLLYDLVSQVIETSPTPTLQSDLFVLNFLIDEIFETPQDPLKNETINNPTPIIYAKHFCAAYDLYLNARTEVHTWFNNLGANAVAQAQELTQHYLTYKKRVQKAQKEAAARRSKQPAIITHEPEAWRTGATPLEKFSYRSGKFWQMFDIPGLFHFRSALRNIQEKLRTKAPAQPDWNYQTIAATNSTFCNSCDKMAEAYPLIWNPWYTELVRCTDYLMLNLVQSFEWMPGSRTISKFEEQCQSLGILTIVERYQGRFYEFNYHFPYLNTTIARLYGEAFALQAHTFMFCAVMQKLSVHVEKYKLIQDLLHNFAAGKAYELENITEKIPVLTNQFIFTPGKKEQLNQAFEMLSRVTEDIQKMADNLTKAPLIDVIQKRAPQPDPETPSLNFDLDGRTVAHQAAEDGKSDTLRKAPELLAFPDNNGITPLHILAWKKDIVTLEAIKDIIPAEAWFAKDFQGRTPLHLAILQPNTDIPLAIEAAQLIIENTNGKKSIKSQDDFGLTPLHYAVFAKQEELNPNLISALIVRTEEGEESLLSTDQFGRTPLHLAVIRAASSDEQEAKIGEKITRLILSEDKGRVTRLQQDFAGNEPWVYYIQPAHRKSDLFQLLKPGAGAGLPPTESTGAYD